MRGCSLFDARLKISVHTKNVVGDPTISFLFHIVCHNEEKIETREKGVREGDVLVRVFMDVIL